MKRSHKKPVSSLSFNGWFRKKKTHRTCSSSSFLPLARGLSYSNVNVEARHCVTVIMTVPRPGGRIHDGSNGCGFVPTANFRRVTKVHCCCAS